MFSIREAQFSFVISIQAFEQVKKVFDNKTITEWVEGGNIKLNYQKRSGFGQYGRVRETENSYIYNDNGNQVHA